MKFFCNDVTERLNDHESNTFRQKLQNYNEVMVSIWLEHAPEHYNEVMVSIWHEHAPETTMR